MILKVPKKRAIRKYCTTEGTQPTFYNNYKWNITFKNIAVSLIKIVEKLFLYPKI